MPTSLTKPGTRKLSDVARHVVQPDGIVSTGYPSVQAKCRDLGIVHDDWQQGLGRLILGKRKNGKYAATVGGVVMSIPRQVGKTFTVGSIIFALCILFPKLMVLWTAHRTRTSNETFRTMQALARRRKIKPFIANVRATNGEQEIEFANGSRILFGAREQGFGRGFAEVDIEVFDEAQILTERALEDMVAATNQAKHPAGALLFYMGTPPRATDPGEVFRNKREKALSGVTRDTVYVELSADADAKPDDRKQWAKGNPSYPVRTPEESMMRLRENVGSDESFLREGLGVWDERKAAGTALDLDRWLRSADPQAERGTPVFGLDVDPDRRARVGVAWRRPDHGSQVMLSPDHLDIPAHEAAATCKKLTDEWGGKVWLGGAAAGLVSSFDELSVPYELVKVGQFPAACGLLVDGLEAGTLHHGNQPDLNDSVKGAAWRSRGTAGEREIDLTKSVNVGPIAAVIRALYGLASAPSAAPEFRTLDEILGGSE